MKLILNIKQKEIIMRSIQNYTRGNYSKFLVYGLLTAFVAFGAYGCSAIKQITDTLANLQRIKFKLENVADFRISGISLGSKSAISDFSITDGLKLANSFKSNSFPVDFVLNVAALNPNDGKGGTKPTLATLTSFDWKLYLDDVETISGNINQEFTIPSNGQQTIIPLTISMDILKFFKSKGYESIMNLALAIGGSKGSAARIKLDAKPTIRTSFGPITYPGRLTLINTEFRN